MKGQISIDYLAGALIFFGSLLFLVSNVMTTFPAFSQAQQRDEMTFSAWSISEVVMNEKGRWDNGTHAGTDWPAKEGSLTVLGVQGDDGLSERKVDALLTMNTTWLREALHTEKKVNVEFREIVDVDTYRSFDQGQAPSFITEPSYSGRTADEVHYGAADLDGERRYVLLTANTNLGWYNNLSISTDWDFTDSDTESYNLTGTQYILVGDNTYVAEAGNTQLSEGKLLTLWRGLGRTGNVPAEDVDDIVSLNRYGAMNGNVVEVTFRVWD